MKKFTLLMLLAGMTMTGFSQFVAMPLNYPYLSIFTRELKSCLLFLSFSSLP